MIKLPKKIPHKESGFLSFFYFKCLFFYFLISNIFSNNFLFQIYSKIFDILL